MVVTCQQMQDAEQRLFAGGVEAEPLMEKAGLGCALAIRDCDPIGRAILFCGKGNNAGDALVVGRWLRKWGWQVEARLSHSIDDMSELAAKKYHEFCQVENAELPAGRTILIDGLLGIGARGDLRGPIGELACEFNFQRLEQNGRSFAIDIPSGVGGDSGEIYNNAVVADHTLSICQPKLGILADQAINHVGRIHEIALPEINCDQIGDSSIQLISKNYLRKHLPRRPFDTHKGQAGRVSIVAGAPGYTGAPILTALGAMYCGAGLITLWVPESIYQIVASQAPPEIMVSPFEEAEEVLAKRADVFAIGPGMGESVKSDWLRFCSDETAPIVIDADMLNALAREPEVLEGLAGKPRVLTPHPGEFKRLFPGLDNQMTGRLELARSAADKLKTILLLKGARSIVTTPEEPALINSTGTAAMASGGMGDVLTGAIAALIGNGLDLANATATASWLLGRAAELSLPNVSASRVARHLPAARAEVQLH